MSAETHPGGKRRSAKPTEGEGKDPLGKLQNQYKVTLATVLVVCGVIAVVGAGLLIWGLMKSSTAFRIIGGAVMVFSLVLLGINIPQVGQRFEVRRKGIRYADRGGTTEMLWEDIVDLEIDRTDDTYLGVASVVEKSNDERRPAGLLTKTELAVTIHAGDGRTIHLSKGFLKLIPKPKDLITEIRMRASL